MNEYLYYDEFRARQADAERTLRREAEAPEVTRRDRRARRREATRRRRAVRPAWELPAGLIPPQPR
ncbi:hypothetical protein [Krasilnikoviella flava]|uniref:Uncharacterized protein n=1 Tax=Krasilnikoviella flava TaxID=526729 RepID=A0A1T5KXD5_9MICO|nr:hypothetical protein [Krasilnikoviella flava]SKC68313.1 hypothetical protein SAMN04324258_2546 [Krasilnikoviella flava]